MLVGKVQGRLALLGQRLRPGREGAELYAGFLHHSPVSAQEGPAAQHSPDAPAVDGGESANGGDGEVPLSAFFHNGGGQRVLRGPLQTGGQDEQPLLVHVLAAEDVGDHRPALGEGAGLVQHHGVDGVQSLQSLGGFDQDAVLRPLACPHHDGYGGGQAQGAGAGDDQDCHPGGEGPGDVIAAGHEPDQGGDGGDGHDHWDKDSGHFVGQLGDGGLGGGSLLHQTDHLGQGGVLAHPAGLKGEGAGAVDGGGGHRVPGALVHRDGLTGEGGLIHGGAALHDHAVHRDGLAGADHDAVAHPDLLHGDLHLLPIPQDGGGLGGQIHQTGDGLAGLALGAGLQELAQGDEGEDHAGGLKIQVHVVLRCQLQISVSQPVAHLIDGEHAVYHGGGGAHSDEGVHVGRPVEQGLKADLIVFVVEIHNWQGEQQLGQAKGHRVFHAQKEAGQGSTHHVAHGDVEQGDQKDEGPDQPVLHGGELFLQTGLGPGSGGLDGGCLRQGGPIARVDDGVDDAAGGEDVLVVLDGHGVGHQADLSLLHAIQPADRLFHMSGAGRTGHACDVKFLFHCITS